MIASNEQRSPCLEATPHTELGDRRSVPRRRHDRGAARHDAAYLRQPGLSARRRRAISLSVTGAITIETLKLYVLGLPALLAGLWLGFQFYGKLDDVTFRKLILLMLLLAGLAFIAAHGAPILRAIAQ
jgi:hypothetical protein